jgi:hypothetical protein
MLLAEGGIFMALPLAIHPHVATRHATVMVLPVALLASRAIACRTSPGVRLAVTGIAIMAVTWYLPYPVRAWWQWVGGPAVAVLATASIALWIQMPLRPTIAPAQA